MRKKLDSRILDEIVGPPYGRWLEIRENGVDELVRARDVCRRQVLI